MTNASDEFKQYLLMAAEAEEALALKLDYEWGGDPALAAICWKRAKYFKKMAEELETGE